MRLQRFLALGGVASRRQAEQLIAAGDVIVNGKVVTTPGTEIDPDKDRVEVNGRRIRPEAPIYRVVLKPRACLATLADTPGRTTLRRYLRDLEPGLQVAGPLDFPSEGVVLLTSDGELADAISRRGSRVPMTYHLKLQGVVTDSNLARLLRGWRWEETPVRPESVVPLATTGKNTWVEMVVSEIRARAIKAGGDVIRHSVLKISRVRFGSIPFEGLAMGGWRDLKKTEVAELRRQAGLAA